MENINVKAAPGLKVPTEEDARKYITDAAQVPDTAYYRRRLADGDLVRVETPAVQQAPAETTPPADSADTADTTSPKSARSAGNANRAKGE